MEDVYDLPKFRSLSYARINATDNNDDLAKKFYDSKNQAVEKAIWDKNVNQLIDGIDKGYLTIKDEYDVKTVYELKNNVAVFAAFKAYRMGKDVSRLLVDEKGNKRSFTDFQKEYKKVDAKYNNEWLTAEYAMAQKKAAAAREWQDFERDIDVYPNLKYMPSLAVNTRDSHRKWYGVVKPVKDDFWNYALPPSEWGCQCYVEQTMDDAHKETFERPAPKKGIVGNPGKTGMVFNPDHPYIPKSTIEKQDVKKEFNNLKTALGDKRKDIEYKAEKGTVRVSLNADTNDYIDNFRYAKTVTDKYKGTMEILAHSKKGKNPELNWDKTVGDRVEWKTAKTVKNFVSNSFFNKLEDGKQLAKLDETFIALDFAGKLSKENLSECVEHLMGEFTHYKTVKHVFMKQGYKVVMIKPGYDTKYIVRKIKQGLLNE